MRELRMRGWDVRGHTPLTPSLSQGERGGWAWFVGVVLALWATVAGAGEVMRLGPKPPAQVKRVVTLAPSLTETVLKVGRGSLLVGVSRYDEAPEVAALPRVGGFVDPSVEAVLGLRPDLVLVQPSPGNRQPVERMAELGAPVLVVPMQTVADTLTSLREVGAALGARKEAEAIVQGFEATRARIRQQVAGRPAPRVLVVYGFEPLVVAGPGSFAHELLTDVGARNVAADARQAYVVFSLERALAARPDVVVDASDSAVGRDKVRALPGLREARWVQPPSKALLQPGPSLGRGLEELFGMLHPDLVRGADPRAGSKGP